MHEFKINKYITLSLKDRKTVIYVNNEEFMQCKSILLNIPIDKNYNYDYIASIDDATEVFEWSEKEQKVFEYKIPPEVEFWGHCSNLQAWVEHEYDTRLLHSNLTFPLLKKLTDVGDPDAEKIFKLEILRRFVESNEITREYLIENRYIDYLTEEDTRSVLPVEEILLLEKLEDILQVKFTLAKNLEMITGINRFSHNNCYYIENYNIIGLKLYRPKIKEFPEEIIKFKKLKFLDLSYNNTTHLPKFLYKLKYLKYLNLECNNIERIPDSFKNFNKLEEVNLLFNKLKEMPLPMKDLYSLKKLYLAKNPIKSFPKKFGNLKKEDKEGYYFISKYCLIRMGRNQNCVR
ncbi:MAG: leucine-rich repeat domain-containing protein [Promethearchaeota archaeon]